MKEILPFVTTWMKLEGIMLREVSQTEKDRYCLSSLTCGELEYKKTFRRNSGFVVARGRVGGFKFPVVR